MLKQLIFYSYSYIVLTPFISDLLSLTSNSSEQLDQGNFILQGRDSIIKIIEDPELNSNHKLKIILPIIPVFVTYFGEIELRGGINLKNLWRKIFKKNN